MVTEMATKAAEQIAALQAKHDAYVREAEARIAKLEAKQAEQWLPLEAVAIDCKVKPGTLLSWIHKDLVKWEKRGGRYYVEVNSVTAHIALSVRLTRSS
jgi:hypothetical protein